MLYDNTPGGQDAGVLPAGVQYKADLDNSGLATAYNYALEIAHEEGFDWLLTLDQDTSLPVDFLCKLSHAVEFVAPLNTVAAIVPCVLSNGRAVSPWVPTKHWINKKYISDRFIGIPSGRVYAVNSASTMRISALEAVGGYDPRFYLYVSDIVMYHRLQNMNFSIFVAGNIQVEHEMSGFDMKNRISPNIYKESLRAEEAFCDEYLGRLGGMVLLLRIFYRLIDASGKIRARLPYFRIDLSFLCRRLFCSRRHRMESWKKLVRQRSEASSAI
jgi:GT2 family glycosyltransferase